jgi:hypothetical protein
MPRRKHKRHKTSSASRRAADTRRRSPAFRPGNWLRGLLIAMAILAVPVAWMAMEAHNARVRGDLSVIGSGVPVVVQVHDRRNRESRRLHDHVERALARLDGPLEWRVVDANSQQAASLARDYGAGRLTLLLFDGRGEMVRMKHGVESVDALEAVFAEHAGSATSRQ